LVVLIGHTFDYITENKLALLSKQCGFIDYSSLYKGYKCLDMNMGRAYISRDAIFDEAKFSFSNPSSTFIEQSQGNNSFNWKTNLLHNFLPVTSVAIAQSNAENPHGGMHGSSPESALWADGIIPSLSNNLSPKDAPSLARNLAYFRCSFSCIEC
jgi:outer membrane receptor for monomeric catechols